MTDLREELAKLLCSMESEDGEGLGDMSAEELADRLLPFVQAQVDAALAHDVEDGFGSVWPPCSKHRRTLQVMRPGGARCSDCETEDYIDRLNDEIASLKAAVDSAVKEERERCAKIVESKPFDTDLPLHFGRAIAAAIREGEKPR